MKTVQLSLYIVCVCVCVCAYVCMHRWGLILSGNFKIPATVKCFRQVRKVWIRCCATLKSEHFNLESHGREKSVTSHTRVEAVPSLETRVWHQGYFSKWEALLWPNAMAVSPLQKWFQGVWCLPSRQWGPLAPWVVGEIAFIVHYLLLVLIVQSYMPPQVNR